MAGTGVMAPGLDSPNVVDRAELVTAALLGTDRRPPVFLDRLEDRSQEEPAQLMLAYAARSAVAQRAGSILPSTPPPPPAPPRSGLLAPPKAQQILGQLLRRPVVGLVNLWLAAAGRRNLGAAPQHWPALVALANRQTDLDRRGLASALGARGRWFCAQNAAWARLAAALDELARDPAPAPAADPTAMDQGPIVDREAVLAEPELIFAAADPWSRDLFEAVLAGIGSGVLQRRTSGYATAVGVRLPLAAGPLVQAVVQAYEQERGPLGDRNVRDGFAVLERTLAVRVEIGRAFADDQPVESPDDEGESQ